MMIRMMIRMLLLLCGPHSISSAGKNVPILVRVRDEWVGGWIMSRGEYIR